MKFRFSIRDLLWLTALAAVLVAWWIDHRGQVAESKRIADRLRQVELELVEKDEQLQRIVQVVEPRPRRATGKAEVK